MALCPPIRRAFSDDARNPRRSRPPVFHIAHDDDDDDHSSSPDEHSLPVPFPPSSPPPSPPHSPLSRGASTPILLSNGKPLKSSLKSSSSSPAMLIPPQAQHIHLRARSEPSTPKNVHFPEMDNALATVRVFKRSARPAALSNPTNGDETETEGEDTPPVRLAFPPTFNYEIDSTKSSPVPCKSTTPANLFLESLHLSCHASLSITKPILSGSILVRNLAFEKQVAIRFTLDEWQTVSEVGAHYVDSRPPSQNLPSVPEDATTPQRGRGWDRFTFTIRLEDYAPSLSTRTLWLVARYRTNSTYPLPGSSQHGPGGEWWDNNNGANYLVGFRPAVAPPSYPRSRPRRETISAPVFSSSSQPEPPTTFKEHALGLIVPSVQREKQNSRPTSPRTGKLNLCNYVPPTVRATSSVSRPFPRPLSESSATDPAQSTSAMLPASSDEDSTSPASSTLSTPSVSPTIIPRIIIGGMPATSTDSSSEKEDDVAITFSKPGHIANWDWSAADKTRLNGPLGRRVDLVPGLTSRRNVPSPPAGSLGDSDSLYDAFVSQWCFAKSPSQSHHGYGDGGIMA